MSEYPFTDHISNRDCTLIVDGSKAAFDGNRVRHGECPELAPVSLDLDAFYCVACRWNGRVSGAWVYDLWQYEYAMAEVYRPEGVALWRKAPNRMLGGIPDELVREGEVAKVLALLNALAEGVVL
jgi:hypothetical protein